MKYRYPAIFKKSEDDDDFTEVDFPDIVCGVTCGTSFENAVFMAEDLLKIMLKEAKHQVMKPSNIDELKNRYKDAKILMIEVDLDE